MDIRDSQRIKQIRDNTEKMTEASYSEIPNYCTTCNHEDTPFEELPCYLCEKYIKYEPQTSDLSKLLKESDEQAKCPWR